MFNQNLQFRFVPLTLTVIFFLSLGLAMNARAIPSNAGEEDGSGNPYPIPDEGLPDDEPDIFTWKRIGPEEYTEICTIGDVREEGRDGTPVCENSCLPNSICAEFSDESGNVVIQYCCIHTGSEGSNDYSDCILEVLLVREDPPSD